MKNVLLQFKIIAIIFTTYMMITFTTYIIMKRITIFFKNELASRLLAIIFSIYNFI